MQVEDFDATGTTNQNQQSQQNADAPATQYQAFDEKKATASDYKDVGWSWGAAMTNVLFLFAIRKHALGVAVVLGPVVIMFLLGLAATMSMNPALLLLLPLVNLLYLVFMVGFWIYMGVAGRGLAQRSSAFENQEQYLGFMKALDHAGKVLALFLLIPIAVMGILASIVLTSLNGARERAMEAQWEMQMKNMELQQEIEGFGYEFDTVR